MRDFPGHWETRKAKRLFREVARRGYSDKQLLSVTQDSGVVARIDREDVGLRVWNPGGDVSGYKLVERGQFVISLRSFEGGIEYCGIEGLVSPAYTVMELLAPEHCAFFRWYFKSSKFISELAIQSKGIRQGKSISFEEFAELRLPFPPVEEAVKIVELIEERISQIDALIGRSARLLELVAEYQLAQLLNSVTKGLNPDARMKDSGIPWLGKIPTHWPLKKVRYMGSHTGGSTPSRDDDRYWNGVMPWVTPKDMKKTHIDGAEEHVSVVALEESHLPVIPAGALLLVVRGMILLHTFPVAVNTVPVTVNQDMKALRLKSDFVPEFVRYLFSGIGAAIVATLVDEAAHGTKALRMDKWLAFAVAIPPKEEQLEIVKFLDLRMKEIDELALRNSEAIEKLKESRASLISAAVVGNIDFQDAVAA